MVINDFIFLHPLYGAVMKAAVSSTCQVKTFFAVTVEKQWISAVWRIDCLVQRALFINRSDG